MARVAIRFGLGTIVTTGIAAGMIFAVFEIFATAILMGVEAAVTPLTMIGAIVLGPAALDAGYPPGIAATTGVVVHMILSVVFAGVFTVVVSPVATTTIGELLSTPRGLALAGIVFGTALWLVNFYLVAPAAGWRWFPEQTNPIVQFLAHSFFFGAPLGWMLGQSRADIRI